MAQATARGATARRRPATRRTKLPGGARKRLKATTRTNRPAASLEGARRAWAARGPCPTMRERPEG
eukprot:9657020-Lingulodinium_polyedra.AAC.1